MKITYNEIYDMRTSKNGPTIIGIHTPVGTTPYTMMTPAFDMFKQYKYKGCSISIVNGVRVTNPSSAYAVDSTTPPADPRDTYDPVLFKGCHGEDLGNILNTIYANAGNVFTHTTLSKEAVLAQLEAFYYTALGENQWKKGSMQSVLRIPRLHPMVYDVLSNHQIQNAQTKGNSLGLAGGVSGVGNSGAPSSNFGNTGDLTASGIIAPPDELLDLTTATDDGKFKTVKSYDTQLFTGKLKPLGWMETRPVTMGAAVTTAAAQELGTKQINVLPKIFMGVLIFPQARYSYNYFRVIITHTFLFRGYRTISEGNNSVLTTTMFGETPLPASYVNKTGQV